MIFSTGQSSSHPAARPDPFRSDLERFEAGRQGMMLFLISLAVLFAASLIGYLVLRLQTDAWPRNLPSLPRSLWLSTAVLALSSVTVQRALNCIRRDDRRGLSSMMTATSGLAALFLALQAYCWLEWFGAMEIHWDRSGTHRWALTSFYVLTGLHAIHVIGGLAPMLLVTARAWAGRYRATRYAGVWYCAAYWHFLGGVWLILFLTLLLGT